MDHQILIDAEVAAPQGLEEGLRRVITAALAAEGVALPCEISVLLTDDAGIRQINADMRDIDRATDVLSFPMFELTREGLPRTRRTWTRRRGCVPWGICASPWSGRRPRPRSMATAWSGR
ncbi:MAG: rRNA maturation RNase YbeY [Lawsonibacter sp.]